MFIPLLFIAVLAIAGHRAGDGAMGCGASQAKDPQPAPGAPDADGTSQAEAKRIIGSGNHAIYIYTLCMYRDIKCYLFYKEVYTSKLLSN